MIKVKIVSACILLLALAACSGAAGPNVPELKSFKMIVPDFSKTSGGSDPAISRDGQSLAYCTQKGEIWISHGKDLSQLEALKCAGPSLDLVPQCFISNIDNRFSNIDWSPDGKRLVYTTVDGGLRLAENFDFSAKTAEVRIIAKEHVEGENKSCGISSPRWSPNGSKIAFFRQTGIGTTSVCVLDIASGEEMILARDAALNSDAWDQPWSPDSKSLVYNQITLTGANRDQPDWFKRQGICVLSVDTKERRLVYKGDSEGAPSWCLALNKIVYAVKQEFTIKLSGDDSIGGTALVMWTVNPDGRGARALYKIKQPGSDEIAAIEARIDKINNRTFEKDFGSSLTSDQLNLLRSGKMSKEQMEKIAILYTARRIGGDFRKHIESHWEEIMKAEPWADVNGKLMKPVEDALKILTKDKQNQFFGDVMHYRFGAMAEIASSFHTIDSQPVWSHDGSKIAFIRGDLSGNSKSLVVLDIASREQRTLFTSYKIDSVSWMPDNESLLFASTRLIGHSEDKHSTCNTPGYPEIWLVEMR